MYELIFTPQADSDLQEIEDDPSKKNILKAVRKTLGFMETNLRHPSLNTHEFTSLKGPNGEKVFEAYVQKKHLLLIEYSGITVQEEIRSPLSLLYPTNDVRSLGSA